MAHCCAIINDVFARNSAGLKKANIVYAQVVELADTLS